MKKSGDGDFDERRAVRLAKIKKEIRKEIKRQRQRERYKEQKRSGCLPKLDTVKRSIFLKKYRKTERYRQYQKEYQRLPKSKVMHWQYKQKAEYKAKQREYRRKRKMANRDKQQIGITLSRNAMDYVYQNCTGENRLGDNPSEVIEKIIRKMKEIHVEIAPKYEGRKT